MEKQESNTISHVKLAAFVCLLGVALVACATQRYGRMTPLSPGERASLDCDEIDLEIEKANFFVEDVQRQRSETSGAHVLGFLGDFGIGNVMEGDAAEESGTTRLKELEVLSAEKSCEVNGIAAVPMTKDDIRAFVSNKTAYGESEKGREWVVFYDPSGEVRGESTGPGGLSRDTGTWTATDDDMLCIQFKKWRDGKLRCWQVYRRGEELTWAGKVGDASSGVGAATWKTGNLENL